MIVWLTQSQTYRPWVWVHAVHGRVHGDHGNMGIGYKQYMSAASSSSLCVQKVYRLLRLKLKPLFFSGRDWFSWAAGDTDGIWALRYQFFKVTSVVSIECTRIWESDCQFLDDKKNRKILSRCMRTWCLIIRLWVQKHCPGIRGPDVPAGAICCHFLQSCRGPAWTCWGGDAVDIFSIFVWI